jgi:hypothetical protein
MKHMTKKINIIVVLLGVVLFSCKKERSRTNNPEKKLHTVTLKINGNGFTQSIMGNGKLKVNSATDPAAFKNYFDILYINCNDKVYIDSTKNLTALNISQQLYPGTYKAVAFGGKYMAAFDGNNAYYYSPPVVLQNTVTDPELLLWKDSFYGSQNFTVADTDLTINLNLNRINALLEINITDALPSKVRQFRLDFSVNYVYFKLLEGTVLASPVVSTRNLFLEGFAVGVPDSLKGKPNFKIDYISLNTVTPFDVTISAYDNTGALIVKKVIQNVKLVVNQKSIYTGKLFEGITDHNVGFPTKIDTAWNPIHITKSF